MAKFKEEKGTIEDAISIAFSEFESLQEEMDSWASNMEEKFSATDKYERLREAADTLSNCTSQPDIDADISAEIGEITWHRSTKRKMSRADRRDEATSILSVVIEALRELEDNDTASQLADELENTMGEADGVEFPGMFG